MRRNIVVCMVAWVAGGVLAACGGASGTAPNPAAGEAHFSGAVAIAGGNAPACNTCHLVQAGAGTLIGPNLSNIGNRAATRIPGQTAEAYIRSSLLQPDDFLATGFQEGIMYKGYGKDLTASELDDLVAYLLTLKSGNDD